MRQDHAGTGCKCSPPRGVASKARPWQIGTVESEAGTKPRVATRLSWRDRLGHWGVRWGFRRGRYLVPPGLYGVGRPDGTSSVFVTANYKMSFDRLRERLDGRNAWILVLDTRGVNVWCAAGKGTFGTNELIHRVESAGLDKIVAHRKLILPQLGATGVSAHQVREQIGWRILYGPVRAADLPAFLDAGMKATPEMRQVRFRLWDRLVLIPVEIVGGLKFLAIGIVLFVGLSGFGSHGYSISRLVDSAGGVILPLAAAFLSGTVLAPALLPWLPGRAFSWKGLWVGLAAVGALLIHAGSGTDWMGNRWAMLGWVLLVPSISSFVAMNFTGSSTYTSLSGVRREMRFAVPMQIAAATLGTIAWLAGRFT